MKKMIMDKIEKMHNDVIEQASEVFKNNIEEVAQEIVNNAQNLQIVPINYYVLVKPYEKNPYNKISVSEQGLAMNTSEHRIFNSDKGEEEEADMWEKVGTVIETSPLCKFVKEGDDVFYRKGQAVPVSFLHLGLEVVSENQIMVVVNEGLKERFKNICNG